MTLAFLLAAAKMDDDVKKNLLPAELGDSEEMAKLFGDLTIHEASKSLGYDAVDLPPFIKHALIRIVSDALHKN